MTRFLSESLEAPEPQFRLQLRQLERSNGNPNADIHLSTEVAQGVREKLAILGLDPRDTTPRELYRSLQNKLADDDTQLTKLLRTRAATHISAEGEVMAGMAHVLRESQIETRCFALKTAKFKALIKKTTPKRTMKQLGYRSLDSLLRHEAPALILTAAQYCESQSWWHSFHAHYKQLTARDFESRAVSILHPNSRRWRELAHATVSRQKQTVFAVKELGTLVILPLPSEAPEGAVMASMVTALKALNDIASSSTYLQLCQVRPDFGNQVTMVALDEPKLQTQLFDQSVPWQLVQRAVTHLPKSLHDDLLEPHVQLKEVSAWHSLGSLLHEIEPSLAFWRSSEHLGVVHDGRPVSMHVLDVALNLCNHVPFEHRIVQHFQTSLWHELLLKYLQPQALEETLLAAAQPQTLAPTYALSA